MALVPGVLESGSLAACSTSCGHNNEGSGSNCKALSDHPPAFLLPNLLALLLPTSRLGSMRAPAWPVLVGLGSRQVQLAEVVVKKARRQGSGKNGGSRPKGWAVNALCFQPENCSRSNTARSSTCSCSGPSPQLAGLPLHAPAAG